MDATKKPVAIPPDIAKYAEKHQLFDLFKRLLSELVIHKPNDPLEFICEYLKRDDNDVPRIVVLGPPASGKRTIAQLLCKRLGTVHVTMESVMSVADPEVTKCIEPDLPIPAEQWAKMVDFRLNMPDVVKSGWVTDGLIDNREQVMALAMLGSFPKHCVLLDAPDIVLMERASGKRIDPETGDVYHAVFDMPESPIAERLVSVTGYSRDEIRRKLLLFQRNIVGIKTSFKHVLKVIDTDQPKADVFMQALTFVSQPARSVAPHTPRILLVGPRGSGKATLAAMLAMKYRLIDVSCGRLIKQAIASRTSVGHACITYVEKGLLVPDVIVFKLLTERLSQVDCVTRGWVLHGYPQSRDQARSLEGAGYTPNRVFFLDISYEAILERLTLRATDPVSGQHYHLLYNPPQEPDTREPRLATNPVDREHAVVAELTRYQSYRDELLDFYGHHGALRVNADQERHTVFETLESMVVNPLPKKQPSS